MTAAGVDARKVRLLWTQSPEIIVEPAIGQTFLEETEAHRKRLIPLALEARDFLSSRFQDLSADLLIGYLLLHDLPKMQNLKQLKIWGYRHSLTIFQRLSHYMGYNRRTLNEVAKSGLDNVIRDLNRIEDRQKNLFFENLGVSEQQRQDLQLIERWADITDTAISRQKEMALPTHRYHASEFLKEHGDSQGAAVSIHLEDHFEEILAREPSEYYGLTGAR